VSFAPVGDWLTISDAETLSLTVEGSEAAGVPTDMTNLAMKAAALLAGGRGARMVLDKRLPAASGIGGGSADAAAALRGMAAPALDADALLRTHADGILGLGADVPMCLASKPLRVRGIGEGLEPVALPDVPAVLVNPRRPVSTPAVFKAMTRRDNAPLPKVLPALPDADALIAFLRGTRNDLEAPARAVEPVISAVLDALSAQGGCGLSRMSGSGATCFGLFTSEDDARVAARAISGANPAWWVASGVLGDQSDAAMPRLCESEEARAQ